MADLILAGADIITLDPRCPTASAIAISGGRIAAVGDRHDVRDWRSTRTEVIDLGGATVTPGLIDSHMHPVLGLSLTAGLDLSACADLGSVRAVLKTAAAAAGRDQWILGWGLDPNVFGTTPIGFDAIEDVLGGLPACLNLFDGHSALASRQALRRAGIEGPRQFASRSVIVCDGHGHPTGHLLEEGAIRLVRAVIPPESFASRRDRLAALLHDMAAAGLTGGHVMDLDPGDIELYAALDSDGQLPLRLRLAPWRRPEDDATTAQELLALQGRSGRLWNVAAVKLFIDGTIDGGTAWLHDPDCHGQSTAPYWKDPRDYTGAVRVLAQAGVQTATHAIGDAAVEHVLDTLAEVVPARQRRPAPDRAHRDAALRPGPAVRRTRRHRLHAAQPRRPLHPRRPQRQLVNPPRRRAGRPGLALPRPSRRRRDPHPGLGLADRAVRPPRHHRRSAAPPPRRPPRPRPRPPPARR